MRKDIYIRKDDLYIFEQVLENGDLPELIHGALERYLERKERLERKEEAENES